MKQVIEVKSSKVDSMVPKVIVAIDPGASGGIAICTEGKTFAYPLEEGPTLAQLQGLAKFAPQVYMEQVGGYIGKEQPGSHMFNFGNGYGFWRGVCRALGLELHLIPPQKWMRAVAPGVIGIEYAERKRALRELAAHWYPELEVTAKVADALGLLQYATGRPADDAPATDKGRSRAQWPLDLRGFKKWCKKQKLAIPKGRELMQAVNWWVEQGRPV